MTDTTNKIERLEEKIKTLEDRIKKLEDRDSKCYGDQEIDDIYEEVKGFILSAEVASTALIQRRFRVGYSKSARIMDRLEEDGIIGPPSGNKPRIVIQKK